MLPCENVVGHGSNRVLVSEGLAERKHQRRLSRSNRPVDSRCKQCFSNRIRIALDGSVSPADSNRESPLGPVSVVKNRGFAANI